MLSGDLLRRLRLSRGLSQQDIADYAKISKRYVGMIERFEYYPSQETHDLIIKAIYNAVPKVKQRGKNNDKEIRREVTEMVE